MNLLVAALEYLTVVAGSVGLILFASWFGFATSLDDYKSHSRRFGLRGDQVWWGSWSLIVLLTPWKT
jgi:hypothetical protein